MAEIFINFMGLADSLAVYRELQELYRKRAQKQKVDAKEISRLQNRLERAIGAVTGLKLARGKLGMSKIPQDLELPDEIIEGSFAAFLKEKGVEGLEAKVSVGSRGIKIGSITVGRERKLILPGDYGSISTTEIKRQIVGSEGEGENLLDLLSPEQLKDLTGTVFKNRALTELFYGKAKSLAFLRETSIGLTTNVIIVPRQKFNASNFKAKKEVSKKRKRKAIVLYVNDKYQKEIFEKIARVERLYLAGEAAKIGSGKEAFYGLPQNIPDRYKIETKAEVTNSILTGTIRALVRRFRRKKAEPDIQSTISSTQLTDSVRRSLRARMPKGPVGGPPLSNEILTNRTGRFINSVIAEFRSNTILYYYMPLYQVHVNTSRNPNETIEQSIRNITQKKVGRQFNIVKGF